ncbi:MAG: response regulator transcription factor [Candidatus Parvibacillus calidus]|nr:MAG: response regulator transcription factor [Candidatus Parvibacillus calidus]
MVVSVNSEEFYAIKAHELGAYGFVHKASSDEELKEAIAAVCQGEKYVSEHQQRLINDQNPNPFVNLSPRELEVLNLLFKGYGVLEISNELNIGQTTASTFKSRILKKHQPIR